MTDQNSRFTFQQMEVDLPKGGGAIRSIGTNFAANPVTGTASLSLPLPISAGRGFVPSPVLAYDSGSGQSVFGLGWGVALGSVSRNTGARLPSYCDDEDLFVLGGDLVPLLDAAGSAVTRDAVEDGVAYRIAAFRQRVEGSYLRIEHWRAADGSSHWRSWSGDNVVTIYGQSAECRVADPDDPARVAEWLVERTFDALGNVIAYAYKREDAGEGGGQARLYPKWIGYNNAAPYAGGTPVAGDFTCHLLFDYGEHDALRPALAETAAWPERADSFAERRAGFALWTLRLCRRVIRLHQFDDGPAQPIDGLELTHSQDEGGPALLAAVRQVSFLAPDAPERERTMPPTQFSYSAMAFDPAPRAELAAAPAGGWSPAGSAQWFDIDGDGLIDRVAEFGGGRTITANRGGGSFAPLQQADPDPVLAGLGTILAPGSPADDGRMALSADRWGLAGHFMIERGGSFGDFRAAERLTAGAGEWVGLQDLDLLGTGVRGVLACEDDRAVFFPRESGERFGEPVTVALDALREGGTWLFGDSNLALFLADMTGDGLADIVRVEARSVRYWPNLGRGRFGSCVVMAAPPLIDRPDAFDPRAVRLSDIDGSGCADLVYLAGDQLRIWMNRQGNGWNPPATLASPFPAHAQPGEIDLLDLLGEGLPRLVWQDLAGERLLHAPLLAAGKPYLLEAVANGFGGETRLSYRSSVDYMVEDREAGREWISTLHFPVHCLSRVERLDHVTGLRFSSTYRYRHGFYDPGMREFRGFAMVEQTDSELIEAEGTRLFEQPPVLVRNWYHTGMEACSGELPGRLAEEFYQDAALDLPLPRIEVQGAADGTEWLDALHAAKGMLLRSETYALDGSELAGKPLAVSQTSWCLIRRQARTAPPAPGRGGWGVFQPLEREALSATIDRNPADPRIAHSLTLDWDEFGNPLRAAAIGYPRRVADTSLPPDIAAAQARHSVALSDAAYCAPLLASGAAIPGRPGGPAYRLASACESASWEVAGAAPGGVWWSAAELASLVGSAPERERGDPAPGPALRLLGRSRNYFLAADFTSALPLGRQGPLGLGHHAETLFCTAALLPQIYDGRVDAALMQRAGYHADAQGHWWARGGTPVHAQDPAAQFYQPVGSRNAFGNTSLLGRDRFAMLVEWLVDPLGNRSDFVNDYRFLVPHLAGDPNGNWTALAFDPLGRVSASAAMGKPAGGSAPATGYEACEGDNLAHPSAEVEYDPWSWSEGRGPASAHARNYELRHANDTARSRVQELREHSGGFGQVVMAKATTRAAPAQPQAPGGAPAKRWIGNGRTVFNNKGQPLKVHEPYFSATSDYEDDPALVEQGPATLTFYDAVGRPAGLLAPDGSWSRQRMTPWASEAWDAVDTLALADPALDPELGAHFASLPRDRYFPNWAERRRLPNASAEDRRAAELALESAGTPARTHADALGRAIHAVADNGARGSYETRSLLDFEGNLLAVVDARGNTVESHRHAMLPGGEARPRLAVRSASMDAGESWQLPDVMGRAFCSWDTEGRRIEIAYDPASRPVETMLHEPGKPPVRISATIYGEAAPNPQAANLRGRPWRSWDQSGEAENVRHDYFGNLVTARRRFARAVGETVAWPDGVAARDAMLEQEAFTSHSRFDALGRLVWASAPASSAAAPGETFLTYHEGGALMRVEVGVLGARSEVRVEDIDYDAKGQRQFIRYGNGARTDYSYDPLSLRLVRVVTTRADGSVVQDLSYTYDPVGNVVAVRDAAQQTVFFANSVVGADAEFEYDALYRLIEASGREHIDQAGLPDWAQGGNAMPQPQDGQRMRRYTQMYAYDPVGNILSLRHVASGGNWTRHYSYAADSNRLLTTHRGSPDALPEHRYAYTAKGSFAGMAHLPGMAWNFAEQLAAIDRGGGETAHYSYDGGGQRVRKRRSFPGGRVTERLYLGGFEIYREYLGGTLRLERHSLHVMDDASRIAMIETKTVDGGTAVAAPQPLTRYQIGNHLGSSMAELDETGALISHEEYHPYGTTACVAVTSAREVPARRYRYTGKERDEETGFTYHGARYYAPWLARWTAADPGGMIDGVNWYAYVRGNPVGKVDPSGRSGVDPDLDSDEEEPPPAASNETLASASAKGLGSAALSYLYDLVSPESLAKQADFTMSMVLNPGMAPIQMMAPDPFAGTMWSRVDLLTYIYQKEYDAVGLTPVIKGSKAKSDELYAEAESYSPTVAQATFGIGMVGMFVLDVLAPGPGEASAAMRGTVRLADAAGDVLTSAATHFAHKTARRGEAWTYAEHSLEELTDPALSRSGFSVGTLSNELQRSADDLTQLLINAVKKHRIEDGQTKFYDFMKNYASAAVRIDDKIMVISAVNKKGDVIHSESRLVAAIEDMADDARKSGQKFEVLQVFSERIPCGDCSSYIRTIRSAFASPNVKVFFGIENKGARAASVRDMHR